MAKKKKQTPKPETKTEQSAKEKALEDLNQHSGNVLGFRSVILFAIGVLLLALVLVQGSAGWKFMHVAMHGLFGLSCYLVPFVLFYIGYRAEKRPGMSLGAQLLIGFLFVIALSSLVQVVFIGDLEKKAFNDAVEYLFVTGRDHVFTSGGAISVIVAYPLVKILGKVGARILLVLAVFVLIMWLLRWNMKDLWSWIKKPFNSVQTTMEEAHADNTDSENTARLFGLRNFLAGRGDEEYESYDDQEEEELANASRSERRRNRNRSNENDGMDEPQAAPTQAEIMESMADEVDEFDLLLQRQAQQAEEQSSMPGVEFNLEGYGEGETLEENADTEEITGTQMEMELHAPQEVEPYHIPPLDFLQNGVAHAMSTELENELRENANVLKETLGNFGVSVKITGFSRGPSVTQYEIQPAAGVKVSKITGLADDIALSLAATGVRIEAPIPGKPVVGIEVPNANRDTVSLRELLESENFKNSKSKLAFAVGRDIAGNAIIGDIAKLPHMIIAGATGSGKSVCTNAIIMSILYHASPDEVKLILIDPKIVEFTVYDGIPHLLVPVVTDPKKASGALNWAVMEMERRYTLFAEHSVRDLADYNSTAVSENPELQKLPQIVIIIDELADLMMTTGKEVEDHICRLAQKARAAGMHLIIATQRPTTDIITGLIKANIPSRIALSVMSQIDSRTILDTGGAEKLLGHGDMLYLPNGKIKPTRVQGCFTSTREIEKTVEFIKEQNATAQYNRDIMTQMENSTENSGKNDGKSAPKNTSTQSKANSSAPAPGSDEEILERAIEFVVEAGQASTSSLQRRLKLGYARAARMMDELEEKGIIGPYEGAKPRKVLMSKAQLAERKARNLP